MTLDEKIGQLFIAPTWPQRDIHHKEDLFKVIRDYHIGGVIFLNYGDLFHYRSLMVELQSKSSIPLLYLIDGEWGLGMRILDAPSFPKNLTLGAIQDNYWIYLLGKEIGRQCKALGFPINLAPVVDVNNNPDNPIIHMRSFGEEAENVAKKAIAYMKGMQEAGILACAKHFPGHGDTATDSHVDLPIIPHSKERLAQVELYPFRRLIEENVDMVMTAHLLVSAFEPTSQLPVTFSHRVVTELLRETLLFSGLTISDALNMKALTLYYPKEEIGLRALLAGHDLLLYGDHIAPNIDRILHEDIPVAFAAIKKGYEDGNLNEDLLDEHVLKILNLKKKMIFEPTFEKISTPYAQFLKKELFKRAMTLVDNQGSLLPLCPKENEVYALFSDEENSRLEKELRFFVKCDRITSLEEIENYPVVIAPVSDLSAEKIKLINEIPKKGKKCVLVLFATPYALTQFTGFTARVAAFEKEGVVEEIIPSFLFGKSPFQGKLPITLGQ